MSHRKSETKHKHVVMLILCCLNDICCMFTFKHFSGLVILSFLHVYILVLILGYVEMILFRVEFSTISSIYFS